MARHVTSTPPALALAALLALGLGHPGPARAETIDGAGYTLELIAPSTPRPGQAGRATLVIRPKAGWKLNQDYPFKVELSAAPTLRVAAGAVRREAARVYNEHEIALDLPVTPTTKGTHRLEGRVKFATCTDTTCDPQRTTFTLPIIVR